MIRQLGNRIKSGDKDFTNEYNECMHEIKKENPYIGPVAMQQEAMARVAQRRAARQQVTNQITNVEFTPQRILFNRIGVKKPQTNESSSTKQTNRSFIGLLGSSTSSYNTLITSNKTAAESQENNIVIPGRRASVAQLSGRRSSLDDEEVDVRMAAHAMRDIELSDSEQEDDNISDEKSKTSQRSLSSLSSLKRIDSLKRIIQKRHSAHCRSLSNSSSITADSLQGDSSDLSKDSIEKSEGLRTDDDDRPQNKSIENNITAGNVKKEMEGKEGSVKPGRVKNPANKMKRRSTLCSVEENKEFVSSGVSVTKSITSLGEGSSTVVAADGSLICSWGKGSLNDSELVGDGGDLICNWDSHRSILSNSSGSNVDLTAFPREINVGTKVETER